LRTLSLALLFLVPGADPAPFLPRVGCPSAARLARAQGRPDLAPQFRAGSVTRGFGDSGIGIGISLPLFDYGSRRHRIRQAEESARAQEARIAATRRQVRQEVEQALARLQAADAVVRDQGGVLEGARRLLEASRTGFQAGATSVIAILEAQRTYRSVLTDYTNALAAAGALLRRLGTLLRRLAVARLSPARGYPPEVSAAGGHPARAELERATGAVPADRLPAVSSQARRPQ
jgi:Outer membrane efflux protein